MSFKVKLFTVIVCFIATLAPKLSVADTESLSKRLKVEIDEEGKLTIESNYLTNYVLRGVDPKTASSDWINIVSGAKKVINFDVFDTEWEGLFPSSEDIWTASNLKNYEKSGPFSLASQYPQNKWKDINLQLTGSSLLDLHNHILNPQTDSAAKLTTDLVTTFLLNLMAFADASVEAVGKTSKLTGQFNKEKYEKIQSLAKQVTDFKTIAKDVGMYSSIVKISIDHLDLVLKAIELSGESIDENHLISLHRNRLLTLKTGVVKIEELSKTISAVNTLEENKLKDRLAERYSKILNTSGFITTDNILNAASAEIAKKYNEKTDDYGRYDVIAEYLAGPLNEIVSMYKEVLEEKKKDIGVTESEKQVLQDRINFLRRGEFLILFVQLIYGEDDLVKMAKESPDKIISSLYKIGKGAVKEIVQIDNLETLGKVAYGELITSNDSGTGKLRKGFYQNISKIGKANTYMKAVSLGGTLGNRVIPMIWDLFMSPGLLTTSLQDGQLNRFGVMQSRLVLDINGVKTKTVSESESEVTIALNQGDTLNLYLSMQQEKLFEKSVSPWNLDLSYPPKTVYDVLLSTPDSYQNTYLCVKKILGITRFFSNELTGDNYALNSVQCGAGTLLGGSEYEESVSESDLATKYRLKSFDSGDEANIISQASYEYNSDKVEYITASITDITSNFNAQKIIIVPAITSLDIEINTDTEATKNLLVAFNAGAIQVPSVDPLVSQSWDWGDGEVTDFPAGTQLGNVTHTYTSQGYYTVTLTLTSESGLQTIITKEVEVLSSAGPFGISVEKLGYSAKIEWNAIQGVSEYSVCLSEEIIVDGVCPNEDYFTSTSDSEFTYHGLNGETTYYVGVSYLLDSGERRVSNNKTFSLDVKERDFNLSIGSVTGSSIELLWEKPVGATAYRVCQSGFDIPYSGVNDCQNFIDGDWWEPILSESMAISTDPSGSPLVQDKDYHFRVVAVNVDEIIGVSNEVVVQLAEADTFVVQATNEVGVEFIVPEGASSCTFNATGEWTVWYDGGTDPAHPYFNADGYDGSELDSSNDALPIPSDVYGSLILRRENGQYQLVGKSSIVVVQPSESLHFLINDNDTVYADNQGEQLVAWSCSSEIVDLQNGLVAHYKFEGNANDSSVNRNHGVVHGSTLTEDRFGNAESAYNFDGVGDLIEVESNSSFDLESIAISAWIKPASSNSNWPAIVAKWSGGSSYETFGFYLYDDKLWAEITTDIENYDNPSESNVVVIDQWQHVVMVYSKEMGTVSIYRNGELVLEKSGLLGGISTSENTLTIGAVKRSTFDHYFNGDLDDIRIYNRVISRAEVSALYELANLDSLPIAFHDDFDTTEPLSDNWDILTRPSCCATGSPSNNQKVDGSLNLDVTGVSSGYSGVSDGSLIQVKDVVLTGDFYIETEFQELSRERNDGYKDNSGAGIFVSRSGSKVAVAYIHIAGNYSGYYPNYSYSQYHSHRIEATDHQPFKELELDELYKVAFRIQRNNGAITTGYKLEGSTTWVDTGIIVTNNEELVVSIDIYSGDGGGTQQNGNFSVAVDYLTVKTEATQKAHEYKWTEWNLPVGNTITGAAEDVGVTYTSSQPVETTPSVYYHSLFPSVYEVPDSAVIKHEPASINTITFDQPVEDPLFVFSSVGTPSIYVPVTFNKDIEILWGDGTSGGGYALDSLRQFTGNEGYLVVRVPGSHSSIDIEYGAYEHYTNFTFGYALTEH